MEAEDSIIVFQHFDNSIDANIVKAKLDAYGIPCFLTEENFSNLYPSNNFITGGTRLHVFARDKDNINELLSERFLDKEDELSRCPRCQSPNVERDITRKMRGNFQRFIYSLFIMLVPQHRVNRCQDCQLEF
jgi:hypothetical protein